LILARRSRRQGLRAGLRPVLASAFGGLDGLRCGVRLRTRAIPPEIQDGDTIMSIDHSLLIRDIGTGVVREATAAEILSAAREHLSRRIRRGATLASPQATRDYLSVRLGTREYEVFCLIHLDNRHRVIDCQELFRGTIDGASVHPREVVKEALQRNAAACILVHNHPSGVAEPSQADELITRRLKEALAMVDIRVLDHLIVAGGEVVSLAERGVL
jgi:DNA repair protein RadC